MHYIYIQWTPQIIDITLKQIILFHFQYITSNGDTNIKSSVLINDNVLSNNPLCQWTNNMFLFIYGTLLRKLHILFAVRPFWLEGFLNHICILLFSSLVLLLPVQTDCCQQITLNTVSTATMPSKSTLHL